MSTYTTLTRDISAHLAQLRKSRPEVMKAFAELGKAATTDSGGLSAKHKELMALAIAVALRCDGCIGFHARALTQLGARPDELHDALAVAIYMGGGPAAMYAANAISALDEFTKQVDGPCARGQRP